MELLVYLAKASLLLVFFYLVFWVFLKQDTFHNFKRGFLLFGLLTSVLLPLFTYNTYIEVEPVKKENLPETTITYASEIKTVQQVTTPSATESSQPVDWLKIIAFIYFTISFCVMIYLIYNYVKLGLIIKKLNPSKYGNYKIYEVENLSNPFSFFNRIIISKNLKNKNERQMVIAHEKVHVSQYHWIDILNSNLFMVFFWFNPFYWLYRKEIIQNLEHIADEYVINKIQTKKSYQYLLLNQALPASGIVIGSHFFQPSIKQRIMMINKSKTPGFNVFKSVLIIPLLIIFFINFQNNVIAQETKKEKKNKVESKHDSIVANSIEKKYDSSKPKDTSGSKNQIFKSIPQVTYSVNSITYKEHSNPMLNEKSNLNAKTYAEKPFEVLKEPAVKTSVTYGVGNKVLILKITKNATLDYLEYVKTLFRNKYKIYISYKEVKFDKNNLLTSLSLNILTRDAKTVDYKIDTKDPVKDIYFYRDYSKQTQPELAIVNQLPEFPTTTQNEELLGKIKIEPGDNSEIKAYSDTTSLIDLDKVNTYVINGITYNKDEIQDMIILIKNYKFLDENTLDVDGDVFRGNELEKFYKIKNKASLKIDNANLISFRKGKKPIFMDVSRNLNLTPQDLNKEEDKNKILEVVNDGKVSRLIITINKNSDKEYLEYIKKYLKDEHQIDMRFSKLKFSDEGLLNKIKVNVKTNDGFEGNVTQDKSKAIDEFYIFRDFSKNAKVPFSIGGNLPEENKKDINGKVITTFQISPENFARENSTGEEFKPINLDKVEKFLINGKNYSPRTEEPMMVLIDNYKFISETELELNGEVLKGDNLKEFYEKEYISPNPYGTKAILFSGKTDPLSFNIMEFRRNKNKNN